MSSEPEKLQRFRAFGLVFGVVIALAGVMLIHIPSAIILFGVVVSVGSLLGILRG